MKPSSNEYPRLAVLVPCYNEAVTITQVVNEFRQALPQAEIYVYDNNSSDDTAEVARKAGATVRHVGLQGKGNVIRRMFADVEADIYVLVDGDATYHAPSAPMMVSRLQEGGLDMVVGSRRSDEQAAYRSGHRWGNRMLTGCVTVLFGRSFSDMLSGYRVFSRRFVKSFPAQAHGFETETELTVHALELRVPAAEVETPYGARPEGSFSKLNTYRDGWRILQTIFLLLRTERPLAFFGYIGLAMVVLAAVLAWPLFITYAQTGLVPRLPTAVLVMGLLMLASLSFVCGLVLDTMTRARHEMKRLAYLVHPAPTTTYHGLPA
jgi:glycosyltransferase involved in cell wall biosynthesis